MDKDALRTELSRVANPTEEIAERVRHAVRDWLAGRVPGTVAAYLAMDSEIEIEMLFDTLPGWRWVLVRVEEDGEVTFRDRDVSLETHRLGMRQPIDGGEPVPQNQIDVYLVPGVAFDLSGARLGRGGGFYDRILAKRRSDAIVLGVAPGVRMIDEVPMADHDQSVHFIVTEIGVRECFPTR